MIRRYGMPAKHRLQYVRRPGVYAILLREQDILVTLQAEPVPEFQLPGGGIDKNEQPIAALHREVREETGWRIGLVRRLGTFRRFTYMPEYNMMAEKICTVYVAQPVLCLGLPLEQGHTAVWLPVTEALHLLGNPGDRGMLRAAISGA